jgi:hypothetical protein
MHENLTRDSTVQGPSDRNFGFVFTVVFLVIGLAPLAFGHALHVWSLVVAAAFGTVSVVAPGLLAPFNRLWARFGLLLHKIVSPIVLGIMFFVVITPMGVVMRLFGKDPLRLRIDRGASTYWIGRTPPGPPADSFIDPF